MSTNWKGGNIDTGNWHRPFIIQQCNELADQGANLIRFQVLMSATDMDDWTVQQHWDWFIAVCQVFDDITPTLLARGLHTIFDFHHPVGGFRDSKWRVFHDDALMNAHIEMVKYAARRFKDNAACAAIEPFNEPKPRSSSQLREVYTTLIKAIRAEGFTKHIVIDHIGSDCRKMKGARPFTFPGVGELLYSAHVYYPKEVLQPRGRKVRITPSYIESKIKYVRKFQVKYKANILIGEFGCLASSGNGQNSYPFIDSCVKTFNKYGMHFTYHSHSYQNPNIFAIAPSQFNSIFR